jgi:hypothetical protein
VKAKAQSWNIFEETTGHYPKNSFQTLLIGRPLATADAPHQTIGKMIGLAVFRQTPCPLWHMAHKS